MTDEPGHCLSCGEPYDGPDTHFGIDLDLRDGEVFVVVVPCCQTMADELDAFGYAAAYGRPLIEVVSDILGDVVAVDEDGRVVKAVSRASP